MLIYDFNITYIFICELFKTIVIIKNSFDYGHFLFEAVINFPPEFLIIKLC